MDYLSLLSSFIRWQDIVDIIFISYILFRLYILFKGTNVFTVLIAILILWFFQKIAFSLGLIVTSWAIQGFTAVAAIIIIVIFRNEIRSVLQTKNLRSLLWGFSIKSIRTPSDVIAESIFQLARNGHGALIVLPGKEDILETVHSGITWEGLVSNEMITSIFWPDNPVHDGAAIISGDRVIQVGAILPLSRRTDLPSYYGTRHRAAAGLAEITDALVIIVSEERGNVVVAKGSRIFSVDRKDELIDIINKHLGIYSSHTGLLKRQKAELVLAAMISFIFITSIWFSFTRGIDTLITLEVPVEYTNLKSDVKIYDTSVNTIRLDLSGSGTLLKSVKPEQVKVTVNLSDRLPGINTCLISEKDVSLPPGVFLKNIKPSYVEVTLDKSIEKRVPVQVDWTGKLPENMTISDVIIEPPDVEIVGRSIVLKDVSTVYTEKVPLDGLDKSGELTIGLVLGDPSIKLKSSSGYSVSVRYIIKEKDIEKKDKK
jgi:diadenylate cyclase